MIGLGSGDRGDIPLFDKHLEHVRRDERGEGRAEVNVLDAEREQGQEDAYRLLLVPGKHEGERELVDAALKSVGKGEGDADGAVCVVALAHVHDAGQASDRAEVEVVEAELAAGEGQNN